MKHSYFCRLAYFQVSPNLWLFLIPTSAHMRCLLKNHSVVSDFHVLLSASYMLTTSSFRLSIYILISHMSYIDSGFVFLFFWFLSSFGRSVLKPQINLIFIRCFSTLSRFLFPPRSFHFTLAIGNSLFSSVSHPRKFQLLCLFPFLGGCAFHSTPFPLSRRVCSFGSESPGSFPVFVLLPFLTPLFGTLIALSLSRLFFLETLTLGY